MDSIAELERFLALDNLSQNIFAGEHRDRLPPLDSTPRFPELPSHLFINQPKARPRKIPMRPIRRSVKIPPLERYSNCEQEEDGQSTQMNMLKKLLESRNSIEGLSSTEFSQFIFGLEVKKVQTYARAMPKKACVSYIDKIKAIETKVIERDLKKAYAGVSCSHKKKHLKSSTKAHEKTLPAPREEKHYHYTIRYSQETNNE